jgi:hypothetical protein
MFMLGTDVNGSCQRVDGDPKLNQCLIGGYVLSGHIRAIVILDQAGCIVARSILRLMVNSETNKPILFLEEIYPDYVCGEFQAAIEQFAKERALNLGCVLLSTGKTDNVATYPSPVSTLSVKQAEYVDALANIETEPYTIRQAQILFDPVRYQQQLAIKYRRSEIEKSLYFRGSVQNKINFLRQAWDTGLIREIIWQRQGEKTIPVSITLKNGTCLGYSMQSMNTLPLFIQYKQHKHAITVTEQEKQKPSAIIQNCRTIINYARK